MARSNLLLACLLLAAACVLCFALSNPEQVRHENVVVEQEKAPSERPRDNGDSGAASSSENTITIQLANNSTRSESVEISVGDRISQDLFERFGDRLLTCFGLVLYQLCYFGFASIFFVLEHFRCFPQHRIQPGLWAAPKDYVHVIRYLTKMFCFGLLPAAFFGAPYLSIINITANRPLPTLSVFAMEMFSFWVIEDIFQYFLHRFLHSPWMYKRIHKQHHDYQVPFAFAATYAHPVEVAILGFCSFAGPILIRPHLFVMICWMIVQQTDACIRHSGYDFPWDPLNWLPLYGGPKFHDAHHEVFLHNYASRFILLDMAFGTYKNPTELISKHRAREARLREKASNEVKVD